MQIQPKTEKEIAEANLLPEGIYDFEVVKGEDAISKAGNEMIRLQLRFFDQHGGTTMVNDYLLESIAYKLRHACYACGIGDKYEAGEFEGPDFEGRTGRAKIGIRKDPNGQFSDQNTVKDYLVEEPRGTQKRAPAAFADDLDDSIPF